MARVKRAVNAHKKRRVVLERASGYRGQRSRLYRKAKEQALHSAAYAYRDRRARKGEFRALWIQRINAATRANGMTYNRFIQGLKAAGVEVDRKNLAEIAVSDAATFAALVEVASAAVPATGTPMPARPFTNGQENLVYNDPFREGLQPFWYNGNKGFHIDLGATGTKPPFPIAEQHVFVPADQFQNPTTPEGFKSQPKVKGRLPIFDSVPGDPHYSPIWHNNWVLVPKDYKVNSVRSVAEVTKSGYKVVSSPIWVN